VRGRLHDSMGLKFEGGALEGMCSCLHSIQCGLE